jgi:hypothetical protein
MLPGFRFLFSAIVLSLSILVFGLGAAALLRAAHEEFVSNPTWRAPAETVFAQQNPAARPVLATLVIEPASDPKLPAAQASAAIDAGPSAEPDKVATLTPAQSAPNEIRAETAESEIAVTDKPMAESPAQTEPAPVQADLSTAVPLAAGDTQTAAVEQTSSLAELSPSPSESVPAGLSEPTTSLVAPVADIEKIATLGGSSVEIEKPPLPKPAPTAPDQSAIKKRLMEERAREKHKAAVRRARLAQQAAQQRLLYQQQPQLQQQQLLQQQQQLLQQQQLQQQQLQQQLQQQTRLQQQPASPFAATSATRSR